MSDVVAEVPADQPVAAVPQTSRRFSLANPWLPVIIGATVAFLASLSWFQWWHPYLEHDDWDMLLPNHVAFVENHSLRLLHEGRWLNNWWWMAGSQGLSPRGAAILYTVAWLLVVAIVVRSLAIRWWSVPAIVALYAAPMMSMLSFWPATLAAPMWVLALTACLLWLTRARLNLHLLILVVGVAVISLGYPPLALVLLPFLVALHHRKSFRELVALAVTFVLAYAVGILLVFTLNDLRFGVFGLKIQSWRNPSPLNGLSSLGHHLQTAGNDWGAILQPSLLPLLACLVALVVALGEPALRRRIGILALALIGAAGLSASSTILNGVDVPARAMGWFWPFIVLICIWGLEAVRPRAKAAAAVALVFVAVWTALYSAYATLGHRTDQSGLDALRAAVVAHHALDPNAPIIFAVPHRRPSPSDRQAVWGVGNALAKIDGITRMTACAGCRLVPPPLDGSHPGTWVVDAHGVIVVQFPQSLRLAGLRAEPEPRWLVPWR